VYKNARRQDKSKLTLRGMDESSEFMNASFRTRSDNGDSPPREVIDKRCGTLIKINIIDKKEFTQN